MRFFSRLNRCSFIVLLDFPTAFERLRKLDRFELFCSANLCLFRAEEISHFINRPKPATLCRPVTRKIVSRPMGDTITPLPLHLPRSWPTSCPRYYQVGCFEIECGFEIVVAFYFLPIHFQLHVNVVINQAFLSLYNLACYFMFLKSNWILFVWLCISYYCRWQNIGLNWFFQTFLKAESNNCSFFVITFFCLFFITVILTSWIKIFKRNNNFISLYIWSGNRPLSQDIPPDVANIAMSGNLAQPSVSVPSIALNEDKSQMANIANRPTFSKTEDESEGRIRFLPYNARS